MRYNFLQFFFLLVLTSSSVAQTDDFEIEDYRNLMEEGDYAAALADISAKDYQNSEVLYAFMGDLYHKLEAYEDAVNAYSDALSFGEDPSLLVARGAAYLGFGEDELCLEDLLEARREIPNDPYLNFVLGNHSLEISDYGSAILCYKKAIRLDPEDGRFPFMLATAYNEKGNYKKSIEIFETVADQYPQAKYNIAISYMQDKQYDVALGYFIDLEEIYINSFDYFFFRAECKYYSGDKDGACLDYYTAANMGDVEAEKIHKKTCLKGGKKGSSKRINAGAVKF